MSSNDSPAEHAAPAVLSYSSAAGEYHALHTGAILADRSNRGRVRLHGPRAAEMVAGLVTNDVSGLTAGQGCYAAALTAKGKIVADVRVFVESGGVLTDAPARAAAAWAAMVRKFVNPRIAAHTNEAESLRTLGIFGPLAHHVVAAVTGIQAPALTVLADYAHVSVLIRGEPVLVTRSPDLGVEGYELFVPAGQFELLWAEAMAAGALPAGLTALEIARVEAGRPEWGIDMDDTTIPQEANFDELHAISYTKGCYVGQETVARLHFRGHVNKHLRGVRATDADAAAIPSGATLHEQNGIQVGDIRSSLHSPRLGAIGLAMIRREVAAGAELIARWAGPEAAVAERRVEVTSLPFTLT